MPIMDGFEFIEAFKKLEYHGKDETVIVIVTSSYHPQDLEKAHAMGIKHYLTKPITPDSLRTIFQKEFSPSSALS
jgi:CheY-like chemotaxis protein